MTHGYPVLEKTSTRRSMNAHVSDSVVSHSFASLARGGDAVRGDSSFPLARPRGAREIEDKAYEGRCDGSVLKEFVADGECMKSYTIISHVLGFHPCSRTGLTRCA
jgi:hypothetical protein